MQELSYRSYDYNTGSYADNEAILNEMPKAGWKVQDSALAYPYLFILWVRDIPGRRDRREPEA